MPAPLSVLRVCYRLREGVARDLRCVAGVGGAGAIRRTGNGAEGGACAVGLVTDDVAVA